MTMYIQCPHCQQRIMTTRSLRRLPEFGCTGDREHYWWQEKFCWPTQSPKDNKCIVHWRCMVCGQKQAVVSYWSAPIDIDEDDLDAGEEWKQA